MEQRAWEVEAQSLAALPSDARKQKQQSNSARHIGIDIFSHARPRGVLKYVPTDFVVEEESIDGDIVRIDEPVSFEETAYGQHIAARLTKCGMYSTLQASLELSHALNIPLENIHYAGVKDGQATTAQRLVIEGVQLEALQQFRDPRFVIESLHRTSEIIRLGELSGNHFSILVRTTQTITQQWLDHMIAWINQHGVVNFYGPQRFYEPRLLSHIFGRLIFQGKYDEALKALFLMPSQFEPRAIANVRSRLSGCYGRFDDMRRVMSAFPYSFAVELRALDAMQSGKNAIDTLNAIGDQTHYWALAYTSLLANELLSEIVLKKKQMPEELPLLLSTTKWTWDTYKKQLFRDSTQQYIDNIKPIAAIRMSKSPRVSTVVRPEGLRAVSVPEGVVFEFSLSKGAYATTLLSYFFDLVTPPPLIAGISHECVDVKKVLGSGSLKHITSHFQREIESVQKFHELIVEE